MTATLEVARPQRRSRRPRLAIASLILVLLLALLALALHKPSDAKFQQRLPSGIRLAPSNLDLGLLSASSVGKGVFSLANDGPLSYRVDRITPECGCMVANTADRLLAPNKQIDIPITVKGSGWGDGLRTKRVAVELIDDKGVRSVVILPVTAAVREATNLAVIPGHVELEVSNPRKPLSFSLFARGDKAIIDKLPPAIDCGTSLTPRVDIDQPAMEGRHASREITVVLRPLASGGRADDTRVLEIVVNGKDAQTIQIPMHVQVSH